MTDRLTAAMAELIEALRAEVAESAPAASAADRLLSIREAADALGIGRSRLYAELDAGRVHSLKVGRRRLIPAFAVATFINDKAGPDRDSGPAGPMEGTTNARRSTR